MDKTKVLQPSIPALGYKILEANPSPTHSFQFLTMPLGHVTCPTYMLPLPSQYTHIIPPFLIIQERNTQMLGAPDSDMCLYFGQALLKMSWFYQAGTLGDKALAFLSFIPQLLEPLLVLIFKIFS